VTPITICGEVVDAEYIINDLAAKIAEQSIEMAALRHQIAFWSGVATARVVDGAPEPDRASESPTGADPGTPEAPADASSVAT
jgi:hypothetical protein